MPASRIRSILGLSCLFLLCAGLAGCSQFKAGQTGPGPEVREAERGSEFERAGDLQATNGQLDLAVMEYDRALAAGGAKERLARKKGEILLAKGSSAEALEEFNKALAAAPGDTYATLGAGQALMNLGRSGEAAALFEQAAEAGPEHTAAYNLLGIARGRQGRHEEAVDAYRRGLAAAGPQSDEASIRNNLGLSLLALHMNALAEEELRSSLALRPDRRVRNNLGLALGRQGRFDEALKEFIQADGEAAAYNNLGVVYQEDGQLVRAAECFEKAIELSPFYNAKAADNLARVLRQNGQRDGSASVPAAPQPTVQPSTKPASPGAITSKPLVERKRPEPQAGRSAASAPPAGATAQAKPGGPQIASASLAGTTTGGLEAEVDKPAQGAASGGNGSASQGKPQSGSTSGFALLESSWRSEDKARQRAAELRAKGQTAFDAAADLGDKGVWHRVLVGPFSTAAEAKTYREGLDSAMGMAAAKILPLSSGVAPATN